MGVGGVVPTLPPAYYMLVWYFHMLFFFSFFPHARISVAAIRMDSEWGLP